MTPPLMPKATAVWLIDNTSLTFDQIGDFCGLHPLEVKGIADGDVAQGIKGLDPVASGQLTRDQIEKAQEDADFKLELAPSAHDVPAQARRRGPRYTPLSRRQDRPDAIYWMIRNHPEISDGQIAKLIGTTKPTIQSIRDRTHRNSATLKPVDPVTLGLCSQIELDDTVQKAAAKKARAEERERKKAGRVGTLKSTDETLAAAPEEPAAPPAAQEPIPEPAAAPAEAAPEESLTFTKPKPEGEEPEPEGEEPEPPADPAYDADSVFAGLDKKLEEASKAKEQDES